MNQRYRALAAFIIAFAFVYLIVLPFVWPKPHVDASVPARVHTRDDIPVTVSISAWHSHFDIVNVRFYVDYARSTAKGPSGIFYPLMLVENSPAPVGNVGLTWPNRRDETYTVRLAEQQQQGMVGPGKLIGKIDVNLVYLPGRAGKSFNRDRSRTELFSVPFEIDVEE